MKKEIRHELFITEKFETSYSYQSVLTAEEKLEVATYRAELLALLNSEVMPLSRPQRPPVFDRYK